MLESPRPGFDVEILHVLFSFDLDTRHNPYLHMAHLPVKRSSGQWGLTWAIFFGLLLLGFLFYLGLEAVAPPRDAVDTELVHALVSSLNPLLS